VIVFGVLFLNPEALRSGSLGSRLQAIAITVVIVVAVDAWFSRRMGLTINERGITLHYAYLRKKLPWAEIQSFEWRTWRRPQIEWIWISVEDGRSIRIPTIQRSAGGKPRSFMYTLLASENIRAKGGAEVDAMTTLQRALATMHDKASVPDGPAGAELSGEVVRGNGETAANTA
jgi:hypothetical protein